MKKLAGHAAGTATWATNVGNEDGQVLMSVLTCKEGFGLGAMCRGLVNRYAAAGVDPPKILYVDRDCCGNSYLHAMFGAWTEMKIRLDIFHFMRRFSVGCTTDAHQLYGFFMSALSRCIFEWSKDDLTKLRDAKRQELAKKGIVLPEDSELVRHLTKKELLQHCRRQTRGTETTTAMLKDLLEELGGERGRDTLGFPLFDEQRMANIWESQRRHVECIQDPEGVQLYTKVGEVKKGDTTLPVYRCARGSTSLESFHLHLARFIPGKLKLCYLNYHY